MNLLGLLLGSMTSQSSVGEVAGKTGLSEKQIKQLMLIAIPILIKFLTKNASSGDGAQSLLGALTQHTKKKEMGLQPKEADETDGGKIIHHILGKKEDKVTQQLSAQSGLSQEQVNQILAIMAPAILSGVSEAASTQQQTTSSASPVPGIFSALLGSAASTQASAKDDKDDAINGTALLQALLGAKK